MGAGAAAEKARIAALLEEQQRASREAEREAEQEAERLRRRIYLNGEVKDAIEWFKQTYRVHPLTAAFALALRPGKSQDENADAWIGFVESIRRRGLCYPITATRTASSSTVAFG